MRRNATPALRRINEETRQGGGFQDTTFNAGGGRLVKIFVLKQRRLDALAV